MLTYGKRVCYLTKNLEYPDRTNGAKELVNQGWINGRRTVDNFATDGHEYK